MARALIFCLKLAVLVIAAIWIADRPGRITVEWLGWRLDTTVGVLILAGLFTAVAAALLYRLWHMVWHSPRHYFRARAQRRRERGYRALTQGMVAVAAGDPDEAKRQARRAAALLDEPPLTLLLAAQAAQLDGDEAAARGYFNRMIQRDETAFLGLRGLLMQAIRSGDDAAALELAERAYAERPETPWVVRMLLDLQIRRAGWAEAGRTLAQAQRIGVVAADQARRQRAALLVEQSREQEAAGDSAQALARAREAVRLDPGFVPAAVQLAGHLTVAGKGREAAKAIETAWSLSPHPALAAAYAALKPEEAPLDRARRFERLAALNRSTADARLALAEIAVEARLWGEARRHLEGASEGAQGQRACRLMAQIEEEERNDSAAAARWLKQAAEADRDPAWVCERCGATWPQWAARCAGCGTFASLAWRQPSRPEAVALAPQARKPAEPANESSAAVEATAPESVAAARLVT